MTDNVVPFLNHARAAKSGLLEGLHRDAFALIEEAYPRLPLTEARINLITAGESALAQECERLNTRLMIIASWLLLQRSVTEGDLSAAQAHAELPKLVEFAAHAPAVDPDTLPAPFGDFVARSLGIQERLTRIDAMLYPRAA